MCLCVFVASEHPLTPVLWKDQSPAFNTVPLSEHEEVVRPQFSLPHVVYAGAHTGCSCGFVADNDAPGAVARSRAALVRYLQEASASGLVEIFVCWEGDCAEPPRVRAERSVASLWDREDWLEELTFTRIARLAA